ncbi:MAG: AsnC family transcriptional regulator, partial [Candidatus Lokiarchaeota archaeon]|nr:AsnC family transcriptional regulator [Candidatus Lokiarchaeota archaeon]
MDVIDLKILEELREDGRKSYNEISENLGKTEATVRR